MSKMSLWRLYSFMIVLILWYPALSLGEDHSQMEESRQIAGRLERKITATPDLNYFSLTYEVYLDCEKMVSLKTEITIVMSRLSPGKRIGQEEEGDYLATFSMTAPKSFGPWSWIAMNVLGGYEDEEYLDMVKSLNVRMEESISLKDVFHTVRLEEVIKEKNYANQTPLGLEFKKNRIYFWTDRLNKNNAPQIIPFRDQVGPLTGFFNYLFYYDVHKRFCVVNVLKRTIDTGKTDAASGLKIKSVECYFKDQPVKIAENQPSSNAPYRNLIEFEGDNLLDLVSGKISFELFQVKDNPIKIPYAVSVEGIYSKNKKYRQDKDRESLLKRKGELNSDIFRKEMMDIEERNTLCAYNIRCFLTGCVLNGFSYPLVVRKNDS